MSDHECVTMSEFVEARKSGDDEKLMELIENVKEDCVLCWMARLLGMSEEVD